MQAPALPACGRDADCQHPLIIRQHSPWRPSCSCCQTATVLVPVHMVGHPCAWLVLLLPATLGAVDRNLELAMAAQRGEVAEVKRLLESVGSRVNDFPSAPSSDMTALMQAARHNQVECVELLIAAGAVRLIYRLGIGHDCMCG